MHEAGRLAAFLDKGGTGKTTSVAHLGVAFHERGHRVLLIDLAGKQGDLVKHFGLWNEVQQQIAADDDWPNISTVFDDQWDTIATKLGDAAVESLILNTGEGPDIIPAHPGLDSLDSDLGNIDDASERYSKLDRFLSEHIDTVPDSDRYDVVIIDLPGLSNNISYNGLWAADGVITPVEMGPFESEQASALRRDFGLMTDSYEQEFGLTMILPNKVDQRTTLAEDYLNRFEEAYPEAIAPTYIPVSQDIRNAAENGQTAFALEEPSSTAEQSKEGFLLAASELEERINASGSESARVNANDSANGVEQ
jgi:chromosome partitioning protein